MHYTDHQVCVSTYTFTNTPISLLFRHLEMIRYSFKISPHLYCVALLLSIDQQL